VIDRDVNAIVNILQRFFAILSLSHEHPLVGQQLLKDFRELFFAIQCWNNQQTANCKMRVSPVMELEWTRTES